MGVDPRVRLTGLFAKRPVPGRVKTRLSPPLGADEAAALAEAMLADAADVLARCASRPALVFTPAEDAAWFAERFPALERRAQRGADLAERLASFFQDAFAAGARSAVAFGSDQPLVTRDALEAAHRALEDGADLVLAPDQDGGYSIVGLSSRVPGPVVRELFVRAPMSSTGLLAATRALAAEHGLEVGLLESLDDLDTPKDLERLAAQLERLAALAPRERDFPRRTHAWLAGFARASAGAKDVSPPA